jgi:hypothetical protein
MPSSSDRHPEPETAARIVAELRSASNEAMRLDQRAPTFDALTDAELGEVRAAARDLAERLERLTTAIEGARPADDDLIREARSAIRRARQVEGYAGLVVQLRRPPADWRRLLRGPTDGG